MDEDKNNVNEIILGKKASLYPQISILKTEVKFFENFFNFVNERSNEI